MTETSPQAASTPRLVDPTFDLLDRPIALGNADEPLLRGPAPQTPLLDGRPVEDPRLVAALSVPHVFSRAEVLDRAAKLGGVLRVLGADGASRLVVAADVPDHVRVFATLAGVRIGLLVVDEATAGPEAAVADAESLTIRPLRDGEDAGAAGGSALQNPVRSVPSHLEGTAVEGGGQVRDLDRLMRDARIVPAPSRPRDADLPALVLDGEPVALAAAAAHLEGLLHAD
ncbi:MAG TPA: hypothetical protein K8V08_02090 [Brevibacterium senegalense]|uniref:Uncharacterized protein n=1 Tax=Brevibacterium senegalense TaxID=1033736 RepID=A0A921SMV4_9MICO|nr:hypothetical protein [Brevibacterium senegalense]